MAQLNIRVDDEIKKQAEQLFNDLGMNLSTAINVFLRQALIKQGMPFEVKQDPFYSPRNMAYLEKAFEDYELGVNFHEHELLEDDGK